MQVTFLGTGTSHGVPVVGCNCTTCTSNNSKNKRFRSSIFIETDGLKLLVDTPPELRLQLLRYKINRVDAILFTHSHADHLMGFDDIRAINRIHHKTIPCYGNLLTINEIEKTFGYIFNPHQVGGGLPQVSLHSIKSNLIIENLDIQPLPIKHGKLDILGYRIKDMAYMTDCSYIPEETYSKLNGLDTLIIDALRYKPHPTHMNIEQVLKVIERLQVPRAYLTHLSHNLEHESVNNQLPDHIQLAYDGLVLDIPENGR